MARITGLSMTAFELGGDLLAQADEVSITLENATEDSSGIAVAPECTETLRAGWTVDATLFADSGGAPVIAAAIAGTTVAVVLTSAAGGGNDYAGNSVVRSYSHEFTSGLQKVTVSLAAQDALTISAAA